MATRCYSSFMARYDVIVVGAGLGGLSAATMLARHGLGVLLLERHNVPGGYATSFVRGRFEFEVALHELSGIGSPEKPGSMYRYLDDLGVAEKVEFVRLPHLYRSIFPGLDETLPVGRDEFEEALCELFPRESVGIRRFLKRIHQTARDFGRVVRARGKVGNPLLLPVRFPHLFRYLPRIWGDVLGHDVRDEQARALLSQYWPYVGLGPSQASFFNLAMTLYAYNKLLPSYPKGRSQMLSSAFLSAFEEHGGEARLGCGVERIITQNGRIAGVVTEMGEEVLADFVVSNADPITTSRDLLGDEHVPKSFLEGLAPHEIAASTVNVYLGLARSPEELGISDYEVFINDDFDLDSHAEAARSLSAPKAVAVTCYNVADPDISPPGTTMVVICALSYGDPWTRIPPQDYVATKNRIAESMLTTTERVFPGLRDAAEVVEVSTPLTNMRYANTLGGSIYGFDAPPWASMITRMPNRGPIDGLYFAGAWTRPGGGFEPTIMSGQISGGMILSRHRKRGGAR